MIDLHCHILPRIKGDDGSQDWSESLAIAKKLVDAGFRGVTATPHCIEGQTPLDPADVLQKIKELNEKLKDENLPLQVYSGSEILQHTEVLKALREGKALPLANSRYCLMELPMREFPEYTLDLVKELKSNGYTPVIAHPERNRVISSDLSLMEDLIQAGALAQINLCTLTGIYGETAQKTAFELLEAQCYSFVGTDLHKANLDIASAIAQLKRKTTPEYFNNLVQYNPEQVLKDGVLKSELLHPLKKGVIDTKYIKQQKQKQKRNLKRIMAASVLGIALICSGLYYADYKVQKELEAVFASADLQAIADESMGVSETGEASEVSPADSEAETEADTKDSPESQPSGGEANQTASSDKNQSKAVSVKPAPKAQDQTLATANKSLKTISVADKAQAYSLVLSKLSGSTVDKLKKLSAGGFTPEEKKEAKAIFYSSFTAEEQQFLLKLYYQGR